MVQKIKGGEFMRRQKKGSHASMKRKLDKLFSQWIRSEGRCEWEDGEHGGKLETAHINSRTYLVTRWLPENALCLCSKHHFYAHQNPLEFAEFVRKLYGKTKYEALRRKAKTSIKKVDLEAIIKKYEELLK